MINVELAQARPNYRSADFVLTNMASANSKVQNQLNNNNYSNEQHIYRHNDVMIQQHYYNVSHNNIIDKLV